MDPMGTKEPMNLKDKIAVVASTVALAISIVTFFKENLFGQHVLKASVVAIDSQSNPSTLRADILLVNSGKHTEVLYKAQFIFSADLSKGGGLLSKEFVGPIVLEAGKAALIRLETSNLTIEALREDEAIKETQSGVHVGVIFDALTPSGELREESKIYRVTEFKFVDGKHVGSKPRQGDRDGLIDLF